MSAWDAAPIESDDPAQNPMTAGMEKLSTIAGASPQKTPAWASAPIHEDEAPVDNAPGYGRGMTNEALQGLTMGAADEAYGAIGAGIDRLGGNDASLSDLYAQNRDTFRNQGSSFERTNPGSALAANIAGGAVPALLGMGAVAKAPTVGRAILQGAEAGAKYGAASGFLSGEDGLVNRAKNALVGTGEGAVLGAAIPSAGYVGGKLIQRAMSHFGVQNFNKDSGAQALLVRALKGDELTPEEMMTKIGTQSGKPVTIADLAGDNTRDLLDQVSLQGGVGAKRANAFLNERQADAGARVAGDIKASLSPSTDTYGLDEHLGKLRSASSPLWEDAMSQPPVWNDRLKQFAEEPVVQSGMSKGIKLARLKSLADNEPFDPKAYAVTDFNEAGDPIISGVPTWRTWQAAKEGLDAQIADAKGPHGQNTKQSNALTDVKNSLLRELDSSNPEYSKARAAWAGPSAQKEAIELGDKFLSLDPEQIVKKTSKMSPDELASFKVGAARALQDRVDSTKGLGDVTGRMFNDNLTKSRIKAAFGQNGFDKFSAAMEAEKQMARTRNAVTGNSKTARRLLGAENIGEQLADDVLTGAVHGSLVGAPVSGATAGVVRGALRSVKGRAQRLNGPVGEALADLLTETNPGKQKAAFQKLIKTRNATQAYDRIMGNVGQGIAATTVPTVVRRDPLGMND